MVKYSIMISNGFVDGMISSVNDLNNAISKEDAEKIQEKLLQAPTAPSGYAYKLRADNLEWELVKLPPIEPEPLTDEQALTRYANTLTGASDPDLISAAETLITDRIKED